MARIASFPDIIRLWPKRTMFAAAIGVSPSAAQQMQLREFISPKHWMRVISAAREIEHPEVTWRLLERLHRERLLSKDAAA